MASTSSRDRHTRYRLAVGAVATILLAGVLAGCSTMPQAVLNVPFNYVADLWAPTLSQPNGNPYPTVIMCLDEASAVFIETGEGGDNWVGGIRLDWAGTLYQAGPDLNAVTLTTPVLQPGCGTLNFSVDFGHIGQYMAIKVTKIA